MDNILYERRNEPYKVSEVNSLIKEIFLRDGRLNSIYIKGEVSNCKYHSSGHIYFTLKDAGGQISAVMFRGQRVNGLNFQLKEGQSVIAFGSIGVYEKSGSYQLYVNRITLDGEGALYQKYEELKQALLKEGLFSPDLKKKIPAYPKRVGIVTASTGAAIQDIVNIANRRNPYVQLILYPAQVQGEGAAITIARGIKTLDQMGLDTIIVGRGGGSIEDLWAFNEEIVARAIFACKTPIISAVGHETDVTIADFVADLRAPTPSAAAELAISDIREIMAQIDYYNKTLTSKVSNKIIQYRNELKYLEARLSHVNPLYQLRQKRQYLLDLEQMLDQTMKMIIQGKRHKLAIYIERIEGLSPLKKLNQGYSLVVNDKDQVVNTIDKVDVGTEIMVSVIDGEIKATVNEKTKKERI
ncbi:MAG: exodeoxyribonuclease VII large subunit [Clostridiales bacterium]|nr:exodeoxyribonuclease VII large subunit [Clostridiales bacterium]